MKDTIDQKGRYDDARASQDSLIGKMNDFERMNHPAFLESVCISFRLPIITFTMEA
ncbi:hypothetical protein ACLBR5_32625 [Escherichia coli]